jgi:ABC-type uncharacterized transport system auxiliary subunit
VVRSRKKSGQIAEEKWSDRRRKVVRSQKKSGQIAEEKWSDHDRKVVRSPITCPYESTNSISLFNLRDKPIKITIFAP